MRSEPTSSPSVTLWLRALHSGSFSSRVENLRSGAAWSLAHATVLVTVHAPGARPPPPPDAGWDTGSAASKSSTSADFSSSPSAACSIAASSTPAATAFLRSADGFMEDSSVRSALSSLVESRAAIRSMSACFSLPPSAASSIAISSTPSAVARLRSAETFIPRPCTCQCKAASIAALASKEPSHSGSAAVGC